MSTWLSIRAAAPSARIRDEGWDYRITDSGAEGSMSLWCLGADLPAVMNGIAGKPATAITIGGVSTTRMIPMQFPAEPSLYAYAARAYPPPGAIASPSPTGTTGANFGVVFNLYFIDIDFRTPKWSADGATPMVTFDRDSSGEMRTDPGTAYVYPSDGLVIPHDVGRPNLLTAFNLTFEGLPALNNSLYDSMIGTVNSTTFYGYPIGTVLFNGCGSSGQYAIGGVPAFRAVQRFQYSRIPHRLLMRPDGQGLEAPVQANDSSKFLFDSADHNQLYN